MSGLNILFVEIGLIAFVIVARYLFHRGSSAKRLNNTEGDGWKVVERIRLKGDQLRQERSEFINEFCVAVSDIVDKHIHTLNKKRLQALYLDDYGNLVGVDKWAKEIEYFKVNVVETDQKILELKDKAVLLRDSLDDPTSIGWLTTMIEDQLGAGDFHQGFSDVSEVTGAEFEVICAQALEQGGWSILRKGGSGDQGVDLIATLGNLQVAVQCKRYSQPVGNKAVQEVAAGRQFEQCDLAVVVSNAGYTASARQLANALGVMLLHHSELADFRDRVEAQFSALISGAASV